MKKIMMLASHGTPTNIVYNALHQAFPIEDVILEPRVPRAIFLQRRLKRLGAIKVAGQLLFRTCVVPVLKRLSTARIAEIMQYYQLDDSPIDPSVAIQVPSANSNQTMQILQEVDPDIVVINGTRILSKNLLTCIDAKFVNMHAGITPLYRGVHGAYWALVENNRKACGVTIHLVDPGIDTGNILAQGLIHPTPQDNFVTYSLLQLKVGLPLMKKTIKDILENRIVIQPSPKGESKLWTHPTLWEYIWYRVTRGVK